MLTSMERRHQLSIAPSIKCLVIEDDALLSTLYEELLSRMNCEVTVATSLSEALPYLEKDFQLVILDGQFPEHKGGVPENHFHAVIHACSSRLAVQHRRPVIAMITGGSCFVEASGYAASGMSDFIFRKPLYDAPRVFQFISDIAAKQNITWGCRSADLLSPKDMYKDVSQALAPLHKTPGHKLFRNELHVSEALGRRLTLVNR